MNAIKDIKQNTVMILKNTNRNSEMTLKDTKGSSTYDVTFLGGVSDLWRAIEF
jgi:hypothetical protein